MILTFVGTIPVVVGAPNIEDFAPSPSSYLHVKELEDVPSIAKKMKYLAGNRNAYNQSLRCCSIPGIKYANIPETCFLLFDN